MASGARSGWDEAGPSSRGGPRTGRRSGNRDYHMERNNKLDFENFAGRLAIREEHLDLHGPTLIVVGFIPTLEAQGWLSAFVNPPTLVSEILLTEFYYFLERPGISYVRGKVDSRTLQISTADIADYLGVPTDGDNTYFEEVSYRDLVRQLVPESELLGRVLRAGVRCGNTIHVTELTPLAYMWWRIIRVNVVPHGGHLSCISSIGLYLLWKIISHQRINLPNLMLNHMHSCWNNGTAILPYPRMLTAMFLKKRPQMSIYCGDEVVRSIEPELFEDQYLNRRQKRKNIESTFAVWNEEGEESIRFYDEDPEDEGDRDEAEEPLDVRSGPNVVDNLVDQDGRLGTRLGQIEDRLGPMQRNQERLILDMGFCYGFQLDKYEFSKNNDGGANK